MNPETFFPALCELLAKSALILAAATLIQRAWKRASAAQRHLVWCAALGAILLLPFTRSVAPRWEVPMVRVTATMPERPAPGELPPLQAAAASSRDVATAAAPRWRWPDWRTTVAAFWAAGVVALLVQRLVGSVRLRGLLASSRPLDDPRIGALAAAIFGEIGLRRRVALRVSSGGCVPLTWGTLRPVLMLPAEALNWSEAQLIAALRHETGHIVRGDHFTLWLAHLACAFYWPNPLVWFATRGLRTAQEQATDDLVLRAGTPPDEYAAQLFDVARTLTARHAVARCAVAMASPSTLERRMLAIVDARRDRRPLGRRALLGAALGVALTLGCSTAAQLRAEAQKSATTQGAQQIQIDVKFVELSPTTKPKSKASFLHQLLGKAGQAAPTVLEASQFETAMKDMTQTRGVDLLSAPRVVTVSGMPAKIEITREFRYPTEYEKDGAGWKPKEFATRNVGVSFDIVATTEADGKLQLQFTPSVVELLGFIDPDTGKKFPAGTKEASSMQERLGLAKITVPVGQRLRPVFSERKATTNITVRAGETVVLGDIGELAESAEFPRKQPARKLAVFVTPSLLKKTPPAAVTKPADPAAPMKITANSVTYDTETGAMKAAGDVTIKTADATIRATEVEIQPAQKPAADPLEKVVLPRVEFRDAKLREAIAFLVAKARESGAPQLNIVLLAAPEIEATISLSMANVPLTVAVNYLAQLSNLTVRRAGNDFVLEPAPPASAPAASATPPAVEMLPPAAEPRIITKGRAGIEIRSANPAVDRATGPRPPGGN